MRRTTRSYLLSAALVASSGCYLAHDPLTDEPSSVRTPDNPSCSVHAFRAGRQFDPIDMVWVVDSSRSMADQQARIRETINDFVSAVQARQFDVHLVMVTDTNIVPSPLGSDTSRYRFVQRSVSSHEPLAVLLQTLPSYRDFLRPSAALHFVVVSDDDSDVAADSFYETMQEVLGQPFVVHAIASPDVDGKPCRNAGAPESCANASGRARATCGASGIGRQYYALAERSGGQEISICIDDWSMVMEPLLEAVGRTEIPCIVDLPGLVPNDTSVSLNRGGVAGQPLLQVSGEAACGQQAAFYMRSQADAIRLQLCPVACGGTTLDDVELRIAVGCSTP